MIQVMAAIYGGDRFHFDGSQLIDNGAHLPGFALDKFGHLRASLADISGHFKADSLEAGPLSVSEGTPQGINRYFSTNETANNIYKTVREDGKFPATGTYGNLSLSSIEFINSYSSDVQYPYVYFYSTIIIFVTVNNNRIKIAESILTTKTNVTNNATTNSDNHPLKLLNSLSFNITLSGKTMKMIDLPTSTPAESHTVFRQDRFDGTSNLLIKN